MKKLITVTASSFHDKEKSILYEGYSEKQAVKIARKHGCCRWDSACKCGGADIMRDDGMQLMRWEPTKPFTEANKPFWV